MWRREERVQAVWVIIWPFSLQVTKSFCVHEDLECLQEVNVKMVIIVFVVILIKNDRHNCKKNKKNRHSPLVWHFEGGGKQKDAR